MKSTENFKQAIESYLKDFAIKDSLFLTALNNPDKNIDDCITYILNEVQKSGCNGFEDHEIFKMAVHYYDEKNIEIGEPISTKVVVNHKVVLSEEEIEKAKEIAKQQLIDEAIASQKAKMSFKKSNAPAKKEDTETLDLFA